MKSDTYSRVFEVADNLLAEGVRPTQSNVREQLGKGSTSTIHKALGEWWQTVGQRLKQGRSYPDLPDPLSDAMIGWWRDAVDLSRRDFEGQRDQSARKINTLRQEHADVITQLRAQQSATLDKLALQMERYQQLQQQLQEQAQDRLELEQRVLHAESNSVEMIRENKVQAGVIERLEEESDTLRRQQSDSVQHRLQQENDNLRTLVADLDNRYNRI
jgi:hypothetical protein